MRILRRSGALRRLPLWLLAALLLAANGAAVAQPGSDAIWLESDSLGMAGKPVSGPGASLWVLGIRRLGTAETLILHKAGRPVRTTLREFGPSGTLLREAVEENGSLVQESLHDEAGMPLTDRRFMPDGTVEETRYTYGSGRLLSRIVSRGGRAVESMRYVYAPDGRLASAVSDENAYSGSGKTARGESSVWRKGPDGLELRVYDSTGRLSAVRLYDGLALVSEESRTWTGDKLASSRVSTKDGVSTMTRYAATGPSEGSVLSVSIEREGKPVSSEQRTYDESGRLSRVDHERAGRRTSTEFSYDIDGTLSEERRFGEHGQLLVIRHEAESIRMEETFVNDVLVARVTYRDGRRIKEELFKDGNPVRTRTFE